MIFKIKFIILVLLLWFFNPVFATENDSIDEKLIGYVSNGLFVIKDSIALKHKIINDISNREKAYTINKVEIQNVAFVNDKKKSGYIILAYDSKQNVKIARWVHLKGNSFYFEEDLKKSSTKDELFYLSYFITNDCVEDCYPYIALINKKKRWVAKKQLVCSKESECKPTAVTLVSD